MTTSKNSAYIMKRLAKSKPLNKKEFGDSGSERRPKLSSFFLRRYIASLVILALITTVMIYWLIETTQQNAIRISNEKTEEFLMNSVRHQVRNYEFESLQQSLNTFRDTLKMSRVEIVGPYGKPISNSGLTTWDRPADSSLMITSETGVVYGEIKIWYSGTRNMWANNSTLALALSIFISVAFFLFVVLGYSSVFLVMFRVNFNAPLNALITHMNTSREQLLTTKNKQLRTQQVPSTPLPEHITDFQETHALASAYSQLETLWLEADHERDRALVNERAQREILLEILELTKISVAYQDDDGHIHFTGTPIEKTLEEMLISSKLRESTIIESAWKFNLSNQNSTLNNTPSNYSLFAEFEDKSERKWSFHRAYIGSKKAIIVREVTQERYMEHALMRNEKLRAIGTLSSSIAHDFNNVLSTILVNINLMKELQAAREPIPSDIYHGIETTVASVSGRIRGLRRLALKNEANLETVDQYQRLKDLNIFLAPTLGTNLKIEYDLEEKSKILCDENEFESCIINLIVNAKQALDEDGAITVRTREPCARDFKETEVKGLNFVAIDIEDNGPGVPKEVAQLIFDPFFSTGQLSQNTGLGLAQVHAFCARSCGAVYLDRHFKSGSRFTLLLPKSETLSFHKPSEQPQNLQNSPSERRIFILDDNLMLATTTARLLECFGYSAHATDSLDDIKSKLSEDKRRSILLSDVHMPFVSIEHVVEFSHKHAKQITLAFYSGNEESLADIKAAYPNTLTLLKPFQTDELIKLLETAKQGASEVSSTKSATKPLIPSRKYFN